MDIRERHFGSIASSIPDSDEVEVDVSALIRRLVLFEHCTIESIRLKEIPALIRVFGADGLLELLNSGIVQILCDAQTVGQVGQTTILKSAERRGGPLPLGSFCLNSVGILQEGPDREKYVHEALQEVQKSPISIKKAQKIELAILQRLLVYPSEAATSGVTDAYSEIIRQDPFIWEALRFSASTDFGIDIGLTPRFTVHDLGENDFRIETDLPTRFGLSDEETHRLIEKGILAAAGLDQRIRFMESLNALTGFRDSEVPLFSAKLSFLARQMDPDAQEARFERVVAIGGLPGVEELLVAGRTLNVEALLKIRDDPGCKELREWFRNVDSQTEDEINAQFESVKSRLASLIDSKGGKVTRFLLTTGSSAIPIAGPFLGAGLGAADAFLIDRLIGKPGPATFLSKSYTSIFSSRRNLSADTILE